MDDIVKYAYLLESLDKGNDVGTLCDIIIDVMRENHCGIRDAYEILKEEFANN